MIIHNALDVLYNEIDGYCCDWLSNLMDKGLITPGVIDDRSICDIDAWELMGYSRVHFFAGLGGWDFALRKAGWRDEPVWTGSCPCQPFSVAGNGEGFDDPRHLWPHFKRLIAERRPPVVFGEQVAAAAKWLGLVRSDLETLDYAVGCIPMEAASADADHFRDRYWFVADLPSERRDRSKGAAWPAGRALPEGDGARLVSNGDGNRGSPRLSGPDPRQEGRASLADDASCGRGPLVDDPSVGWGEGWTEHEFRSRGFTAAVASIDGCQYLECPDGKWRRLPPPGVRWLGNGIPARISKLRAIGNAIDHRPAVQFIKAYRSARGLV